MKRLYFADSEDSEGATAVVANSLKEAKKLAFCSPGLEDVDWIDINVKWKKDVDIDFDKLSYGVIEDGDELEYLLQQGVFYCLYYWDCPKCKSCDVSVYHDEEMGGFYCSQCEDEENE